MIFVAILIAGVLWHFVGFLRAVIIICFSILCFLSIALIYTSYQSENTEIKIIENFDYKQSSDCQKSFFENERIIKPFACDKKINELTDYSMKKAATDKNKTFSVFSIQDSKIIFSAINNGKILEFPTYREKTMLLKGTCKTATSDSFFTSIEFLNKYESTKTDEDKKLFNEIIESKHTIESTLCEGDNGTLFILNHIKNLNIITGIIIDENQHGFVFSGKNNNMYSQIYKKPTKDLSTHFIGVLIVMFFIAGLIFFYNIFGILAVVIYIAGSLFLFNSFPEYTSNSSDKIEAIEINKEVLKTEIKIQKEHHSEIPD